MNMHARERIKLGTAELGKLHAILNKAFPKLRNPQGGLDVRALAAKLQCTRQAIYQWFQKEQLPLATAELIVSLSNGKVKIKEFDGHLYIPRRRNTI